MITGKVTSVYGADINTDDIIPAMHLQQSTERGFFAEHAFSKFDEAFRERCRQAEKNIIVAGENFGCGSSREQAVYALSHNNVACVIAPSFPDIFHRNCLTNGLTLIALEDTSGFELGHDLSVDLENGYIENHSTGERIEFEMNDHVRDIFVQGGMVGRVRQHLDDILSAG